MLQVQPLMEMREMMNNGLGHHRCAMLKQTRLNYNKMPIHKDTMKGHFYLSTVLKSVAR